MMENSSLPFTLLGQSGCRIVFPGATIYCDPYLSHSVEELDSSDLKRLIPIPARPEDVTDANFVLITHDHLDHCDPKTLPIIASSSPKCRFMGPPAVLAKLESFGIAPSRFLAASEEWGGITDALAVRATPAAHPTIKRDKDGRLLCVGYALKFRDKILYIAGDTSLTRELYSFLKGLGPIHAAVLPVNERNFFRDERNILGNMTVREAFLLAQELHIKHMIPVHWDMFSANEVFVEEIKLVYKLMSFDFSLLIYPDMLAW